MEKNNKGISVKERREIRAKIKEDNIKAGNTKMYEPHVALHPDFLLNKFEKLEKYKTQEIINYYEKENLSVTKISKILNTHQSYISKILKKNNVKVKSADESHRKYAINEDFFDVIDTQEKAYFLGFLYADGCNHKESNCVTIDLQTGDKEILEKFTRLIFKENPEKQIKNIERLRKIKDGEEKIYYSSILNINSKHICTMLDIHGCVPRKTKVLKFPDWLNKDLVRHFIRGYYDGDGSIHLNFKKDRQCSFKITSTHEFVKKIHNIIKEELGLHTSLQKATNSCVWDVCNSGNRLVERFLDWLYKDSTIYLERKFNSYLKLKKRISETDKLAAAGTRGYSKSLINKYK
jgi:hypothetical protein